MKSNHFKSVLVGSLLATAISSVVHAQSDSTDDWSIEEIVVTAQKRAQSSQDVPIALSAYTDDMLTQVGASDFKGLTEMTPGFSVAGSSDAFPAIYIRGIGSNDSSIGIDPSIGVYIDGIYSSRKGGALNELLDVERVEILKGPQGTLFGRNSIGGAISIVTKKPSNEFSGMLGAEVGSYNGRAVKGLVNIPLIEDTLYLRASGVTRQRDGWQENQLDGKKGGERDRSNGRLKLTWLPSDNLEIEWANSWSRYDDVSTYTENLISLLAPADPLAQDTEDKKAANGGLDLGGNSANDLDPVVPVFERILRSHSLTIDWDINEDLSFSSLSSYLNYRSSSAMDYDGSPYFIGANTGNTEGNETISQEFRLTGSSESLDWFVGVSAAHETNENVFRIGLFDFLTGGAPFFEDAFEETKTDSYAIYGDATWQATDRLNVTFGARYSIDEKSMSYENPVQTEGLAALGGLGFIMPAPSQFVDENGNPSADARFIEDEWKDFSPRFVLDYAVTDDAMIYASITRGYKSGGFNTYPSVIQDDESPDFLKVLPDATEPVDTETSTNIEVGIKSTWMDNRLMLNASLYSLGYDDLQVRVITGQVVQLANAGKASSKGAEVDVKFHATQNLTLMGNIAWMNAEYDEFISGGEDLAGSPLLFSPKWSGNISVDHSLPLEDLGELRTFVSLSYKDEQLVHSAYGIDSYISLSARVSLISQDESWELALFGKNLTDESYITNYVDTTNGFGFVSANRNEPRTIGASLNYNF